MTDPLPIYGPNEMAPGETREPEVNWQGQFRIKCPDGKARWYTRCTTFIGNLEDTTLLDKWRHRMVIDGFLSDGGELWEQYSKIPPEAQRTNEDKQLANDVIQRAFVAGGGNVKSEQGTFMHKVCEAWDRSDPLPGEMTEADHRDLAAYIRLRGRLADMGVMKPEPLLVEQRVVVDHLKVTGTFDRAEQYRCLDGQERNVILDIKTGPLRNGVDALEYGWGKMAQQDAMYADGECYEDDGSPTGRRWPLPDISNLFGLILHLPQGSGTASLYEVDLSTGRRGVDLSKQVREWRNYSKRVWTRVPLS